MERVVFFGSPAFALPSLEALIESEFKPALVVTRPDRPAGRGRKLVSTPVRELAARRGIPVMTLERFRDGDAVESLRKLAPDFFVVVSFGKIFPDDVLAIPRKGCVNLHASLLPAYRGASPIQAAIVNGDAVTGVTTMEMAAELDAGPIYLRKETPVDPDETAGELSERLARLGAPVLLETLRLVSRGELRPSPQPAEGISKVPVLRKRDGLVPWELEARRVHDHIRGMNPWPGSFTYHRSACLKVRRAALARGEERSRPGGTILEAKGDIILVACGTGAVRILELQAEGRKALGAAEFLRGFALEQGETLGGNAES